MKLLLCTHNAHKIKELKALIAADAALSGNVEVLSLSDVGFEGDIVEDGTTFEENAIIKASVGAKLGYVTVADDSGIEVDALHGSPGVYSARFAGEICDDEANNALLLEKLDKVEKKDRTARYVSVIACVFPDGTKFTVRGTCEGEVLREYCGNGGFGYDPLFFVYDLNKTFAQATAEEKNAVSHRGKAMRLFCEAFRRYM